MLCRDGSPIFFFNAYRAFVKFGPDVLLDAIWNVDKIRHCSKSFHALLIVLSLKRPPEMAVGATNKTAFKYMVSSLGVDDLFNYVKTEKTGDNPCLFMKYHVATLSNTIHKSSYKLIDYTAVKLQPIM